MIVEVTFGQATESQALRRAWEDHVRTLRDAGTWLGGVAGTTDDGRFVAVVRTSASPTVTAAESLAPDLAAPPEVLRSDHLIVAYEDRPWDARFVQVMSARVLSRARYQEVEARIGQAFLDNRPDVLASYRTWPRDDLVIAVDHFSSEEEARAGEQRELPPNLREGFQEWLALLEETFWFDLTDPWLAPA
ncbi:MAG: hypothetical protein M3O70_24100 [Actinomycetota bacterium]|nr:hypothetical protein [Actinomycetota bacterium]